VALGVFFALVLGLCAFKVVNLDFGWQLKAGELIWSTGSIPTTDVFSYVAEGNPWVDSHWMFQTVLYAAYSIGGLTGTIALRAAVILAAFALLIRLTYRQEYAWISVLVCTLAVFLSFHRFTIRPELFTLLFLAVFVYYLTRFDEHPKRALIAIPLCQVLWTNSHGLHVLGPILVGLYLLGGLLDHGISRFVERPSVAVWAWQGWRQRLLLLPLTIAGVLMNANGFEGIRYPFKLFMELREKPTYFSLLGELQGPFAIEGALFPAPSVTYKLFLLLSVLVILCRLRHARLSSLLPYAAFFYLSVLAVRNMLLFAVVATPVTVEACCGVADWLRAHSRLVADRWAAVSSAATVLLIVMLAGTTVTVLNDSLYERLGLRRRTGIGESDQYPAAAAQFVANLPPGGNIYNSANIGGYLIWKLYPKRQVAIDGRWEIYGDFLNELSSLQRPGPFMRFAEKNDVRYLVLRHGTPEYVQMGPWLQRMPEWALAIETSNAVVLKRVPSVGP
jgi:hypothetical protein